MTPPDEQGDLLARADRLGRRLENALLALLLFGMIGLAASQLFMRAVLGTGVPWADEALRLMVLWGAMAGAVAASRDDVHLRIDLLSRFLPARARDIAAGLVDLFAAGVAGVLAWYSLQFVMDSRSYGDTLLGDLPAWWFQAILPAAFFLIAWRYVIWVGRRLRPARERQS